MNMTIESLVARHQPLLKRALEAIATRGCFGAFPDSPEDAHGGPDARAAGEALFNAHLGKIFQISGTPDSAQIAGERLSPYGLAMDVSYEYLPVPDAIEKAGRAGVEWGSLPFIQRAAICVEMMEGLNARAVEMAYACMHSCGQPFAMAFQAGTAHALDRGLEAVAYAVREMSAVPSSVVWEKQMGKALIRVEKTFDIVPRGTAAVIGCSTFPTWNSYPGLFASLVTGNPVIVKPHPSAVLPLAICVQTLRRTLKDAGLDPDAVQLLVDTAERPETKALALHRSVRLIDFTGSSQFGNWLESEARHAHVFTEKAGINALVIHGTSDFAGMVRNIAITLCLYSGQMCTTPQNLYVPATGIETPEGLKTPEEFRQALAAMIRKLTADPGRAIELLGAVQSTATLERVAAAARLGATLLESRPLTLDTMPDARIRTPLILADPDIEADALEREHFGPVSFVVEVATAEQGLEEATRIAQAHGAISWSVYSTDEDFVARSKSAAARAGVHLTLNMTGPMLVNQSVAFSDFHVSGNNPAGNASISDQAFVLPRFTVLQTRRYLG